MTEKKKRALLNQLQIFIKEIEEAHPKAIDNHGRYDTRLFIKRYNGFVSLGKKLFPKDIEFKFFKTTDVTKIRLIDGARILQDLKIAINSLIGSIKFDDIWVEHQKLKKKTAQEIKQLK